MAAVDDLLFEIFDGRQTALNSEFEAWVRGSRRFAAFAATNRGKIRAKLRYVREDGIADLRAELEAAVWLLHDERFAVEYEKYAASKQRGPDFTVTFRTHTEFNVEVRRIHTSELDDGDAEARTSKLMSVVCDKVGQMPPGIINLLWLTADREILEAELARATLTLRELAERKVEVFFTRRGFESALDFLRRYQRLSGTLLHQPGGGRVLWLNPLARHKLPREIATAIQRLPAG